MLTRSSLYFHCDSAFHCPLAPAVYCCCCCFFYCVVNVLLLSSSSTLSPKSSFDLFSFCCSFLGCRRLPVSDVKLHIDFHKIWFGFFFAAFQFCTGYDPIICIEVSFVSNIGPLNAGLVVALVIG